MRHLLLLALLSSPLAARAQTAPANPAAAARAPAPPAPAAAAAANPAPSAPPDSAPAAPALSADEIARRASAQLEKKPRKLTCTVELEAAQLDSSGKPSETETEQLVEVWSEGKAEQGLPTQISVDGKPLAGDELKKAIGQEKDKRDEMKEHEAKSEGGDVAAPFAQSQLGEHKFTLLRQDQLGGRPVYVLGISPVRAKRDDQRVTREGIAYVDMSSFVPLRIESRAAPLPAHVERMELLEEFALTPQGETAPQTLRIEVRGGILFFKRTYRATTRWRDCK